MHACTIIARNYLPAARSLAASFLDIHPEGTFAVLVIDDRYGEINPAEEIFELLHLNDVGIDLEGVNRFAAIYSVMEFATAVKPWLLSALLARYSEPVTYLDPDTYVYASLSELDELAREHDLVLTPHAVKPMPRDGKFVSESQILGSGIFNLGYITVSLTSGEFLEFWRQRLYSECIVEPTNMRFVDQRWVDFAPGMFDTHIVRDPGFNVAYWNLDHRAITEDGAEYRVNGELLRFFHFSGFDPRLPHLLSKHQGDRPRILLSEHPSVARLCSEYARVILANGYEQYSETEYGYARLPSGQRFDAVLRHAYRTALFASELHDAAPPPNPVDAGTETGFVEWCAQIAPGREFSRYLTALYEQRPDLQRTFPAHEGADRERFREWIDHEIRLGRLDSRWRTSDAATSAREEALSATAPQATRSELLPGIRVAGYFRAEMGVGELGRLATSSVMAAGVSMATHVDAGTVVRQEHRFLEHRRDDLNVNLVCVNADELPNFAQRVGPSFFERRYTIGLWAWEVEDFPERFDGSFDLVDEVWALSSFAATAIAKRTAKPVLAFPPPIVVPELVAGLSRASFGLNDSYLFLFCFDLMSVPMRKNAAGLISAFTSAFDDREGPTLVIKAVNGELKRSELEQLKIAAHGRADIVIMDRQMTAAENATLISLCDCYVSLHRSEGFGLTLAEAMALGKPVIATGYSGNLDFMDAEVGYLVPFRLVPIPAGCDPYPEGSFWAEPDLEVAAELMRAVFLDPSSARLLGEQARARVLDRHTVAQRAEFVRERFAAAQETLQRENAAFDAAPQRVDWNESPSVDLDLLSARAGRGATIEAPSRHPRVVRPLRRVIARMLRNHSAHQRELDVEIVSELRRSREQLALLAASYERDTRETSLAVGALSSAGVEVERGVARLSKALESHSSLPAQLDRVGRDLAELGRRYEALRREVEFGGERIDDVARESASALGIAGETREQLLSIPYMTDPSEFLLRGADDKEILGFRRIEAGTSGYASFEDVFRGPEELIAERQLVYVPYLASHEPVIDLGSGRAELLAILRDRGISAVGVDNDKSMVERSAKKGFEVHHADALTFLQKQDDASVGGVFSAQFVEHVPAEALAEILAESHRALVDGGVMIAETVNPYSVGAFRTFWTDITHHNPIFPEVLLTYVRNAGFREAFVLFPNGSGRLRDDRWSQGEYAVIATK